MDFIETENTLERMMLQRAALNCSPINGSIELLPLCNMNCDMCYIRLSKGEMESQGRLRSVDEWLDVAQQMKDSGVLFLLLTGGEPLLYPDFKRLFIELKKMGMILTINTNGTLIDEDWALFFSKYKPRRVNITLYGSSEKTYDSLCHYADGFQRAMDGILLLKEYGVKVKINGSMTKANIHDLHSLFKIGKDLDIPVSIDTYMLPGLREREIDFSQQARLLPKDAAYAGWEVLKHDMPVDVLSRYVQNVVAEVEKGASQHPDGITCMAGHCSFMLDWRGYMRPCVTLEEPAVSVFEHGFQGAWQKICETSRTFRLHKQCVICPLRIICQTCVASAYLETGCYDGLPQYLCEYSKELYRLIKSESENYG